jgi:hypothetical protein
MSYQPQTNTELVTQAMNFSKYGGLIQGFIIHALQYYCEQVLKNPEKIRNSDMTGMIHPEAWIGCAQELKGKMDAFYDRNKTREVSQSDEKTVLFLVQALVKGGPIDMNHVAGEMEFAIQRHKESHGLTRDDDDDAGYIVSVSVTPAPR